MKNIEKTLKNQAFKDKIANIKSGSVKVTQSLIKFSDSQYGKMFKSTVTNIKKK